MVCVSHVGSQVWGFVVGLHPTALMRAGIDAPAVDAHTLPKEVVELVEVVEVVVEVGKW